MPLSTRMRPDNIDDFVGQSHFMYKGSLLYNAIKNKNAMYINLANGESKQIGYVITGKTDFQNDAGKWTSQYIDLWIDIVSVVDTVFS